MRRIPFLLVLLAAVCFEAPPLAAQSHAMSFSPWRDSGGVAWGEGVRNYLFAFGEITPATPAALTAAIKRYAAAPGTILVLNSPGGNLDAGLAMGRIIRAHGLWTEVGTKIPLSLGLTPNVPPAYFPYVRGGRTPPFPGYCYSSCTLAFLGGVVRTVGFTSDYGVHRFYFEGAPLPASEGVAAGEQGMADIAHYLKEMGVDPDFLEEMAKKGPNAVTHLTAQRMAELDITTPFWQTSWSIEEGSGNFYYDGMTEDASGARDDVYVYCGDQKQQAAGDVVMMDIFVAGAGKVDPASFVPGITDYNLRLDRFGEVFSNSDHEILRPAFVSSASGRIGVTIGFTLSQFSAITASHYMGFAFYNPNSQVNFLGTTVTVDQSGLDRFARRCLPPANTDFTLSNLGPLPLSRLETRVAGQGKFGANRLASALLPKAKTSITMPHYRGCQFDLLMQYSDKSRILDSNLNLCAYAGLSIASPSSPEADQTTDLAIKNIGKRPITALYISASSDRYWGPNRLAAAATAGSASIAGGGAAQFQIPIGKTCQFDLKIEYAGGAVEERGNANLCVFDGFSFAAPQ